MIKIYGSPRSSSGRCYLLLEELGLPYQAMPLDMASKEHKSEEFRKLNPNGKVPCLVDGDYVIWESVAINFYLAEKYRPELLGASPEERGHVQQWSIWSMTDLQPPLVDILIQLVFVPEDKRDMALVEKAKAKVPPMLEILNQQLKGRSYLLGEKLTVADFNVASVVNIAVAFKMTLEPFPALRAWLDRITARPAFKKLSEIRS